MARIQKGNLTILKGKQRSCAYQMQKNARPSRPWPVKWTPTEKGAECARTRQINPKKKKTRCLPNQGGKNEALLGGLSGHELSGVSAPKGLVARPIVGRGGLDSRAGKEKVADTYSSRLGRFQKESELRRLGGAMGGPPAPTGKSLLGEERLCQNARTTPEKRGKHVLIPRGRKPTINGRHLMLGHMVSARKIDGTRESGGRHDRTDGSFAGQLKGN